MTEVGFDVLAVHGWGYSAAVWDGWRGRFDSGVGFDALDRGYFGEAHTVKWKAREPESMRNDVARRSPTRVLILHSMAPLFAPEGLIEGADLVVVFGGFLNFHPAKPAAAAQRSREVLARMKEELTRDPGKVLESFWMRCGRGSGRVGGAIGKGARGTPGREDPPSPPTNAIAKPTLSLHLPLLAADLDILDSESVDLEKWSVLSRVLLFHGTEDRIVPLRAGEELAEALGDRAIFHRIPEAGHALPFTHIHQVGAILASMAGLPFRNP